MALKTQTEEIIALKTTVAQLEAQVNKRTNTGTGDKDKWAWKTIAPKANQALSKQVNNKTYHWCPNHVKWCIHTPAECKGLTKRDVPTTVNGSTAGTAHSTVTPDPAGDPSKRKLELTNAFNAFVQDADDGEGCI